VTLGVKGPAVAGLLDKEEALGPSDDLVRRGLDSFVEVDDTVAWRGARCSGRCG
jgi:aryl carrier-like protein